MPDVARYKRILLLTEGNLGVFTSKTAVVMLRFRGRDVVGVIDSTVAGRALAEWVPNVPDRPILASVAAAAELKPDALFVGIHPAGGRLPPEFRRQISDALRAGIDVVSGLHTQLSEDAEFANQAEQGGAQLIDLRRPPEQRCVATGRASGTKCRRILTVGSDCNVGKMVTALALTRAARARGLDARFIATGQTGIMVSGQGVAIDAVVSDFAAGAIEQLVLEAGAAEVCFIEGQGSLAHPGFSGVSLSILHGACPDAMIMVHHAGRRMHRTQGCGPLPSLKILWQAYESVAELLHPARIVGVALNTHEVDDRMIEREKRMIEQEFGVPVVDPLADDCEPLLSAALVGDKP